MSFLDFSILDAIDILLTAFLLYQIYRLARGTPAIRIFLGIAALFVVLKMVQAMEIVLLSQILGSFIGLGLIVLIIVFQQEIRKFLLYLGSANFSSNYAFAKRLLRIQNHEESVNYDPIVLSVQSMIESGTGAIIVFTRSMPLGNYALTGELIHSRVSSRMIETIFQKDTPLHDGAIVIKGSEIQAAGVILPVSDNTDLPKKYGLRHRAALGLVELTDAVCIVVSEERRNITIFHDSAYLSCPINDLKSKLNHLLN